MRELTKSVSALLVVVMLMSVVLCAPFTVSAIEQEETENATVEETTVAVQQETSTPNTEVTEPKTKPPVLLTSGSSDYITRAEWLHSLTETFNMTVEEDNYPDNYYSDISSLDSYYRDVMVAVEFGVIDLEAGEAFHPNDYTTRDFAASTLNFCLGYKLDSEKYTFSDVSSTEHPSDAQIAINRGWFELENNKFEPTKYITVGESTLMLEDAVNTMSQEKVNNNFSSKYEFADDVIVVPKSVPVSIGSDGTVTLTNYSETISSGNTFAVYAGDVPDVYTAVSVTKTGTQTVIKTKETEYDSAVTNVNAQGTSQVLDSYFELADGVELVDEELEAVSSPKSAVSVGAGTNSTAVGKEGNLAIKSKTLSKDLKIGDLKINLKVVLSNLNVKYIADKNTSHYMVKLDGDATITTNVSMQDVISALGGNSSVDLASYSVPGVGKVAISVFLNVKGEATITYDTLFSVGIEYTKSGGCRAIKSFTKKSFTIVANVTIDAGLKIYANVNILELIKGEIYATTGVKVVTSVNAYDDGKKPELCINIKGWWYVTLGYSATIVGQSYSDSLNVFNANNSPARLYAHYEDGKEVNSCTREASETKYVSPSTTKYGKISAPTSRESGSSLIDISYGSTTVDESWTLTSNREIYGDLNFKSGAINLNGYTLTVFGNLIQSGGVMYINNGTLNVGGDYRIQTILSNGDVADSSGYLQITNNADLINIKGDFITQSSKSDNYNILNAGTMKISGNFYQYDGSSYNFNASGSHMVIFEGDYEHIIHLDSTDSGFHKVKTSEKSSVVFDNGINNLTLYNDLTINGDTIIKGTLNLNGYTLTVNGNLNTNNYTHIKKGHLIVNGDLKSNDSYFYCNGGTVDVKGSLLQNSSISLAGGIINISGNLIQVNGGMSLGGGILNVGGDYRIQTILSNGDVADSSGYLQITNNADLINIKGDFITQSSKSDNYNILNAGTMKISGNFYQYDGSSYNFNASGSHMVIFEGDYEHIIHLDSTDSGFHKVKTSEKSSVVFDNGINNLTLYNDLTINGDTIIKGTLNLNGYTLTVNGNLNTNNYTHIKKGHLIVNGDLKSNDSYFYCNGGTVDVKGSLLQNSSISLAGGIINISGNLIQVNGGMSLGGGILNVGGDYRIQTILSNGDVADSSGYLQITNNADLINIKGDFITQSSKSDNYNILNAGTMKISGNFYQYDGNSYNFNASGTHLVVLNGSDTQLVHFDSKSSHFNYLELTKDKTTGYVFDPYNCWNKLITKEYVNSVKIYSQSTNVKQGDNLQFISKINGSNVSTADVIWSISGNTDSNTTISDKGILSVSLNEKAKQITVTATSVADNTKSASVTITIEEIVPVINGIAITPSVASTVCGQSCQFNAVVFGFYNPSQSVIWSISGNKSSNTMIDSNGLLKIADNETSKQITVKAVSSADKTITASVTVDVMQIKITSTVDNVTVTMETGETQQLKAVVTGTNNPSQEVVWSVSGNNSENTVINDNGEITIGKDETSSLIIVKAVSTEDSSKYGEFAISIKQNTLIGDTNGDGNVTIADTTTLQKYLANIVDFNDEQLAVADTNGDGSVSIADATEIQRYIAQLIPSLG